MATSTAAKHIHDGIRGRGQTKLMHQTSTPLAGVLSARGVGIAPKHVTNRSGEGTESVCGPDGWYANVDPPPPCVNGIFLPLLLLRRRRLLLCAALTLPLLCGGRRRPVALWACWKLEQLACKDGRADERTGRKEGRKEDAETAFKSGFLTFQFDF